MQFKTSLLLSVLSFRSARAEYEPQCDTTRAQRDAMRKAVIGSLTNDGPFKKSIEGKLTKYASDSDPQGESIYYNFGQSELLPSVKQPIFHDTLYNLSSEQDAILLIYCLPPVNTWGYFSVTDYAVMFDGSKPTRVPKWEPNAELGDSLNQMRLGTTAPDSVQEPWGYTTAIIHTPDQTTADKVTAALVAAGLPQKAVNIQVIPSDLHDRITFGQDTSNTAFSSGMRVRAYKGPVEDAEQYAKYEEPVLVFTGSSEVPAPISTPKRITRGSDTNEKYLAETQKKVIENAIKEANKNGYKFVEKKVTLANPIMDTSNCFDRFNEYAEWTCFQGYQDNAYGSLKGTNPAVGGYSLVVGAIHSSTGLASYSSSGYNNQSYNTADLVGTADAYLEEDDIHKNKMFVLKIEPKTEPEPGPYACEEKYKLCGSGKTFVTRAVLDPNTLTGPNFDDLLPAVMLKFEPKDDQEL